MEDTWFYAVAVWRQTGLKLVVDSLSKWVNDWMYDGWVTSTGKPVKYRDLLQLLLEARANNGGVSYEHVPAHTGGDDWESRWMEVVDQAAKRAARAAAQNAAPVTSRPRFCMMTAIGPEPNIRTYRDLYRGEDGGAMTGEDDAATAA